MKTIVTLVFLLGTVGARADGFPFANGTVTYVGLCSQTNPTVGATAACSDNYGNNKLAQSSLTATVGGGQITASGIAKAQAGTLGTATSVSLTKYSASNVIAVPGQDMPSLSESQASWIDTVQFTGLPAVYNLTFNFNLDGAFASNNSYFQSYLDIDETVEFMNGQGTFAYKVFDGKTYSNGAIPGSFSLTISGLTQTYLQQLLTLDATTTIPYSTQNTLITGAESANFANTLQLSSLSFTDASGNAVNGVTVSSGSGYQYVVAGASPVPEPSTIVFGLTGLVALAMWKRRELVLFARGL